MAAAPAGSSAAGAPEPSKGLARPHGLTGRELRNPLPTPAAAHPPGRVGAGLPHLPRLGPPVLRRPQPSRLRPCPVEGGQEATAQGVDRSGGHPACTKVGGAGASVDAHRGQDAHGVTLRCPALQAPGPRLQFTSMPRHIAFIRVLNAEGPVGRTHRIPES
eukprot:13880420-Alexandrium_andersonii.AAC.1